MLPEPACPIPVSRKGAVMPYDVTRNQVLARPVSAYLEGRAMQMAYRQDQMQLKMQEAAIEALPKRLQDEEQMRAMELMERQVRLQQALEPPTPKIMGDGVKGFYKVDEANGTVTQLTEPQAPSMTPYQEQSLSLQEQRLDLDNQRRIDANNRAELKASTPSPTAQVAIDRENRIKGEKAVTRQRTVTKNLTALEGRLADADIAITQAGKAIKQSNFFNTGVAAQVPGYNRLTNVTDMRAMLDSLKAKLGFKELADMRFESPTGGALGQVAVQEINYLQSVIASLDQAQSEEALDAGLVEVKRSYKKAKVLIQKAMEEERSYTDGSAADDPLGIR